MNRLSAYHKPCLQCN